MHKGDQKDFGKETNQQKQLVSLLKSQLPSLDEVTCLDILESFNWDIKEALYQLKGTDTVTLEDIKENSPSTDQNNGFITVLRKQQANNTNGQTSKHNQNIKESSSSSAKLFQNELDYHPEASELVKKIRASDPNIVILMRGAPGSGKSYLARQIIKTVGKGEMCSADNFFISPNGVYEFNPSKLTQAHEFSKTKCVNAMIMNVSPIIVDNTNTQVWEMLPYAKLALQYSYQVVIMEPNTIWKKNARLLATKCVHSVPQVKIKEMVNRFEDISTSDLIKSAGGGALKEDDKIVNKIFNSNVEISKNTFSTNKSKNTLINFNNNDSSSSSNSKYETNNIFSKLSISNNNNEDAHSSLNLKLCSNEKTNCFKLDKDNEIETFKYVQTDFPHPDEIGPVLKNLKLENISKVKVEKKENQKTPVDKDAIASTANILLNLFPNCKQSELEDIFQKCGGDINWCIDILLEGGYSMNGELEGPRETSLTVNNIETIPKISSFSNKKKKKKWSPIEFKKEDKFFAEDKIWSDYNKNTSSVEVKEFLLNGDNNVKNLGTEGTSNNTDQDQDTYSSKLKPKPNPKIPKEFFVNDTLIYDPYDGEDWMDFQLNPKFLNELMNMYSNPFGDLDANCLDPEELNIRIPPEIAFKLYKFFVLGILQSSKKKVEEENSAKFSVDDRIQKYQELERQIALEKKKMKEMMLVSPTPDLLKIIDIEARLDQLQQSQIEIYRCNSDRTMAAKLGLNKLGNAFSSIPSHIIEDHYDICCQNYKLTLSTLQEMYPSAFNAEGLSDKLIPCQDIINENVHNELKTLEAMPQHVHTQIETMSAVELRKLALTHHGRRLEYQSKACVNSNKGIPGITQYYGQMCSLHTQRMIQVNNLAAAKILAANNIKHRDDNILDLHSLFVREAADALVNFIEERIKFLKDRNMNKIVVKVITGRGKNSDDHIAKVMPEMMKILSILKIQYTPNVGSLELTIAKDVKILNRFELYEQGCKIYIDEERIYRLL